MPISTARKKANAKYEAKAYDKTLIRLPKGRLDEIRAHIECSGESLNGFISRAITETMDRDSAPKEVIFSDAVDILAEWYKVKNWDVLDQLKGLKDKSTPTPGDIGKSG